MNRLFLITATILLASMNLYAQTAEEWKKQGNAALDSNDYDKAIECYNNAIAVDSNYFDAYYNLGLAYANKQDYDKAIEYFNKALTINDKDTSIYFILGDLYTDKQDYGKAIESYKKGIRLNPNAPDVYSNLGFLYQEKGSYIYATMYLKKAAQLGDTSVQNYFTDNEMSWEDSFEKPDYEQIKQNIEDKQSNFYYPKLWDRFQQGDSTMTLDEKRHLYYGYVFNENYAPYGSSSKYDSDKANAILNKENPTKKEWETLISMFNEALKVEPFHCRYIFYQAIAYQALNKQIEVQKNYKKINCIYDAMVSTGDGLSKERAIHVIAVYNEYDHLFLNYLSSRGQSLVDGGYDVLYLFSNEDGLEELWFDISQPFKTLTKMFDKGKKSDKKLKK